MTAEKICTAMIVDDVYFMRNLLRSILEIEGYTIVAEAENGEDAVAKYRVCRPDLVLMDVIMPVKNGIDATREIISFDMDACVVMCSMVGQKLLVRLAREAGAKSIIFKPVNAEDVLEVLQKVVEGKSTLKKEGMRRKAKSVQSIDSGRMTVE